MAVTVETGTLRLGPETQAGRPQAADVGFRPEAAVLWWAAEADPQTTLVNAGGVGLWAPGSAAATAWAADDGKAAGALRRWRGDCAFLAGGDPTGGPELVGSLAAGERGFTLAADGRTAATWIVHFLVLGGADVQGAAVGRLALGRTGPHPVAGLGFRPDFLFFAAGGNTGPADAALGAAVGFAAGPGQQAASGFEARTLDETTVTRSSFRADAVVAVPRPDDSWEYDTLARLASVDDDGFTLACDTAPAADTQVSFLAVSGGRHAVVLGAAPRGRRRRTRVAVSFAPAGMLTLTSGLEPMPRIRDLGRLCLGAASGRRAGCVSWSVRRRGWPPEPRSRSSSESAVEVLDTTSGRLYARAEPVSLDGRGLSLRWPLRDRNPRQFACAVFGPAAGEGGPRWRQRLRRFLPQ